MMSKARINLVISFI